jgi:hypothetical protein
MITLVPFVNKKSYSENTGDKEFFLAKLSVVWAFFPILFIFLFSIFIKPVFQIRFFVWSLPAMTLIITLIIGFLGLSTIFRTILYIFMLFILIRNSYLHLGEKGSGIREAVQFINGQVRPEDAVIAYPYLKSFHIDFYLDKLRFPRPETRSIPITRYPYYAGGAERDPDPDLDSVERISSQHHRIFLLCDGSPVPAKMNQLINRTWLPRIKEILAANHAVKLDSVFADKHEESVRIIIYE